MLIRDLETANVQKIARAIVRQGAREYRKEYTRIRKIARKRILRAQAGGELLGEEIPPTLKEIGDDSVNLAKAIRNVERFLKSPRSTAAGRKAIREKTVESLRESGYEGISESNVDLFEEYMSQWRRKYEQDVPEGRRLFFDSDFAVEIFDEIKDKFTSKTNASAISRAFNNWLRENGYESEIVYLK